MAARLNVRRFRGRLTAQDWADVQWYRFSLLCPRGLRLLAGGLLKVVAALCLYVLIEHGPNIFLAWGFLLSTTFALQLLFLPILIRAKAVGYYQKHANGFVDTTVALSEDGVSLEIERSQKAYGWDEVAFVIVTPNGLVFCEKGSRLLFCLPSRLFSEHVTCEEVQLFLESMGVALRRVS